MSTSYLPFIYRISILYDKHCDDNTSDGNINGNGDGNSDDNSDGDGDDDGDGNGDDDVNGGSGCDYNKKSDVLAMDVAMLLVVAVLVGVVAMMISMTVIINHQVGCIARE